MNRGEVAFYLLGLGTFPVLIMLIALGHSAWDRIAGKLRDVRRRIVKPAHCPHERIRGIFGDEIIYGTPGFRRLQCEDCLRFLDGPVSLATVNPLKEFDA